MARQNLCHTSSRKSIFFHNTPLLHRANWTSPPYCCRHRKSFGPFLCHVIILSYARCCYIPAPLLSLDVNFLFFEGSEVSIQGKKTVRQNLLPEGEYANNQWPATKWEETSKLKSLKWPMSQKPRQCPWVLILERSEYYWWLVVSFIIFNFSLHLLSNQDQAENQIYSPIQSHRMYDWYLFQCTSKLPKPIILTSRYMKFPQLVPSSFPSLGISAKYDDGSFRKLWVNIRVLSPLSGLYFHGSSRNI